MNLTPTIRPFSQHQTQAHQSIARMPLAKPALPPEPSEHTPPKERFEVSRPDQPRAQAAPEFTLNDGCDFSHLVEGAPSGLEQAVDGTGLTVGKGGGTLLEIVPTAGSESSADLRPAWLKEAMSSLPPEAVEAINTAAQREVERREMRGQSQIERALNETPEEIDGRYEPGIGLSTMYEPGIGLLSMYEPGIGLSSLDEPG